MEIEENSIKESKKAEPHSINPLLQIKFEEDEDDLRGFSGDTPVNENVIVKQEDIQVTPKIQILFHDILNNVASNDFLDCNECVDNYGGYCLKCSPVSHILNSTTLVKNEWKMQEGLPNNILEIRNIYEKHGVFALKTLPKNAIFGPFDGLEAIESTTGYIWMIKNKKLMNIENGNWMKCINSADNVIFSNLEVFQFNGNLYFQSKKEIKEGEELIALYNDEDIEDSNDDEGYYIPIIQEKCEEVFVCNFCLLGFSQDKYLIAHKAKCLHPASNRNVTEIIQCSHCDIWLDKQEYLDYHAGDCWSENSRKWNFPAVLPSNKRMADADIEEIDGCSTNLDEFPIEILMNNTDIIENEKEFTTHVKVKQKDGNKKYFKCSQCAYETNNKFNLNRHVNNIHKIDDGKNQKCSQCSFETKFKRDLQKHVRNKHTSGVPKDFNCIECDYETNSKWHLNRHIKNMHTSKDLKDHKCPHCLHQTKYKDHLKKHILIMHQIENNETKKHIDGIAKTLKCTECSFKTNSKYWLTNHVHRKHTVRNGKDYKCMQCSYETDHKKDLAMHIKNKHSLQNEKDYKCSKCDYETNYGYKLQRHIKFKHTVRNGKEYKCAQCPFETNHKWSLGQHIKKQHRKM